MAHTHTPGLNRCRLAFWLACGFVAPALGAAGAAALPKADSARDAALPERPDQLRDFDIPAQPLAEALKRYAVISNWPTLFQGRMVAGRTSSAIRGRYSPEAALQRLLEGTGLIATKVDAGPADAFILKEIAPRTASAEAEASSGVDFDYGGQVQARVWDALCANRDTAAQAYRALLRFRIDTAGHLRQAHLLGSTGNARRDAAMLEVLGQVRMDRPPPAGMAQPVTMLILPADPSRTGNQQRCGNANDSGAPGS